MDLPSDAQIKIFLSVAAILLIWLLRKIILTLVLKRVGSKFYIRYQWRKISSYIAFALGVLIVGRIWFREFHSLATFLGLVSAGLAIALKDPVTNLAGWMFLIWKKPFALGDRIQAGEHAGDVIDIGVFQFTILEIGNWVDADQTTGRVIHIPNSKIFVQPVANYTQLVEFIWDELDVVVTFESNWKKAREILQHIAATHSDHYTDSSEARIERATRNFMVTQFSMIPGTYIKRADNGVCLTIRYLCDPRKRRAKNNDIWQNILEEFANHNDINFAYPTQRFFNNRAEGKEGTKKPFGEEY